MMMVMYSVKWKIWYVILEEREQKNERLQRAPSSSVHLLLGLILLTSARVGSRLFQVREALFQRVLRVFLLMVLHAHLTLRHHEGLKTLLAHQ